MILLVFMGTIIVYGVGYFMGAYMAYKHIEEKERKHGKDRDRHQSKN